jgi:hypothetical protein
VLPEPAGSPLETPPDWRGAGRTFSGAVLATAGLPAPFRAPFSVTVVRLRAV